MLSACAVQCSAVQCSALQRNAVQVQVQYNAGHYHAALLCAAVIFHVSSQLWHGNSVLTDDIAMDGSSHADWMKQKA